MNNKIAIRAISNRYNELKEEYKYFVKNNMNTDYIGGELSAITYVLHDVYGLRFDKFDKEKRK